MLLTLRIHESSYLLQNAMLDTTESLNTVPQCHGNTIKKTAGDAAHCNDNVACDRVTETPNDGHTACGRILTLGLTSKFSRNTQSWQCCQLCIAS